MTCAELGTSAVWQRECWPESAGRPRPARAAAGAGFTPACEGAKLVQVVPEDELLRVRPGEADPEQ